MILDHEMFQSLSEKKFKKMLDFYIQLHVYSHYKYQNLIKNFILHIWFIVRFD